MISGKKHYMTRKEKSKLGILKCPTKDCSYADLSEFHNMWCEYISDLLNTSLGRTPGPGDCLNYSKHMSRADLHGAQMQVIKSKNPSLIGLAGICVCDNRDTFGIITKEDKYKSKLREIYNHIHGVQFNLSPIFMPRTIRSTRLLKLYNKYFFIREYQ